MANWFGGISNSNMPANIQDLIQGLIANGVNSAPGRQGGQGLISSNALPINDMSPYQNINPFNTYFQNALPSAGYAENAGTSLPQISQQSSPIMTGNSASPVTGSSNLFGSPQSTQQAGPMNGLGDLLGQGGSSGNFSPGGLKGGMGSGDFSNLFSAMGKIFGSNGGDRGFAPLNFPSPSGGRVQYNPQPFRRFGNY